LVETPVLTLYSWKVTVPVGDEVPGPDEVSVSVKVTAWPAMAGFGPR
jgi:hypothetical protein